MKPTTDIVEELRLYNRWRRGDEAITAPDPTALGKLLDDAADRIEHLFASGIHTCHADCQRPMCVLRRERDKAHADLSALRVRVADLEQDLTVLNSQYDDKVVATAKLGQRAAELEATIAELTTDGNAATLAANLAKASKRNAELVEQLNAYGKYAHDTTLEDQNAELAAALRMAVNELQRVTVVTDGHPSVSYNLMYNLRQVLGRAESATPAVVQESLTTESATPGLRTGDPMADPVMGGLPRYDGWKLSTPDRHPDTERLDWLEAESPEVFRMEKEWCVSPDDGDSFGHSLRAAIDAARKQEASK